MKWFALPLIGMLFLAVPQGVKLSPARAVGVCPGGGTKTLLVSGLEAVVGGSTLDRTSPANLVANGDFTIEPANLASSSYPDRHYWGVGGLTVKNTVTATNQPIPSWTPTGGSASTYAFWTKSLTGNSNNLVAPPNAGESAGRVYFGNGITSSISPSPTKLFNSEGFSTTAYTITPGGSYGSGSTPPAIDQNVTLVAGENYRMYFHQSTENFLAFSGIAALDISGYQRVFFEVTPGNKGYMVEFTAVSSVTNIKFLNWGHLHSPAGSFNGGSLFTNVTNRSATSSEVTLTFSSPHGRSFGSSIGVADVGSRYDTTGATVISVPSATTLTYMKSGTAESSTATTGYIYKPEFGPSAELVLDDVIINACSASGIPPTPAPATPTPVAATPAPAPSTTSTVAVSVGNSVWFDSDGDGVQDAKEPGIAGVTLTITKADGSAVTDVAGNAVTTTVTDAKGQYLFANLPPGSYKVSVATPAGYTATKTGAGTTATDSSKGSATSTNLTTNGASDQTLDFGFIRIPAVSVGNSVWFDSDRDGVQDAKEPGIAGVTLTITKADGSAVTDGAGNAVTTTVTDARGRYLFANLPPGTYKVSVSTPDGYSATKSRAGTTATDSSKGSATSANLTKNGASDQTLDFGFIRKPAELLGISVGNSVWFDSDADGVQDAKEPGIAGVTLTITKADGSAVTDLAGNAVTTTVTDAKGRYLFTNLPPGSYKVRVSTPSGYSATKTGAGTSATDSSKGSATSANLTENGSSDMTLDFGFKSKTTKPALPQTGVDLGGLAITALALLLCGLLTSMQMSRRSREI
jgi:uncharacterized protein (DUF2141 family)